MSFEKFLIVVALGMCACRTNREDNADRTDNYRSSGTSPSTQESRPRETPSPGDMNRTLSSADREFVSEAANGGMFEVESSQLAIQKGVGTQQRELAEMMIEDHGKANRELMSLSQNKNAAAPMSLDAKHRGMMDDLRRLNGVEFERLYHELQVKAHDDAIRLFEREARDGQDSEIKAFADKTLPTLRKHRQHLDNIEPGRHQQ